MEFFKFSELSNFTPKQWTATDAADSSKYVFFGGARGPGKSYWLRWYLIRFLLRCAAAGHRNVRVMLGSEDYPSLYERQITKIKSEFPTWLGRYFGGEYKEFRFYPEFGGGVIALRNLENPFKYQSAEFAAIAVDELNKNPYITFDVLRGSLRWPGITHTPFIGTGNPMPNWSRDLWIEKRMPTKLEGHEGDFVFVPALPNDNPHLPIAYWEMLGTLAPSLAQAWRHGDWFVAIEGLVYLTFSADNVTDQDFDPELPYELAVDDGYVDPRAILFIQKRGAHILVFDEIYHRQKLEEESVAEIIRKAAHHSPCGVEFEKLIEDAGKVGYVELSNIAKRANVQLPELAAVSHEAVALRRRLREANIPARNWLSKKAKGGTRREAIRLTRSLILDGKKHRTIKINRRCHHLLDEIRAGYRYPPNKETEKPADENDHACQALESWCWLRVKKH